MDITNHNTTLVWGHDAVSQHRIRQEQADTGSLVRSTRTRRRYTRAAYTLHEHNSRSGAAASPVLAEPHRRPGRVTFVHAMARLTPDQRHAIQLRYLDGYPRDAVARLMNRSIEAVRCLERRAIRRMQAVLIGAHSGMGDCTSSAVTA